MGLRGFVNTSPNQTSGGQGGTAADAEIPVGFTMSQGLQQAYPRCRRVSPRTQLLPGPPTPPAPPLHTASISTPLLHTAFQFPLSFHTPLPLLTHHFYTPHTPHPIHRAAAAADEPDDMNFIAKHARAMEKQVRARMRVCLRVLVRVHERVSCMCGVLLRVYERVCPA